MTIFDRYLLRAFMKVLLISFLSLTGLYVVIDTFNNLEEFLSYANRQGSLLGVLIDYYGARVLSFFDRVSSLLALLAAIFTLTWFQRSNELTAVTAAGISKLRIVRSLVIATVVVAILAAANREIGLPRFRDKLSRNAQDWLGENSAQFTPRRDNQSNILITGKSAIAARREIEQPNFRLPGTYAAFGRQLIAARACSVLATSEHPQGFLLEEVTQPANIGAIDSLFEDQRPIILTARDHDWLKPNQCFVASDITYEHLTEDSALRQYSSTPQLIMELHNPSLDYGAETRVTVHRRFVQPILDVTLVLLGLPLVLSRSQHNMFVAAGQCLLLVGVFYVVGLVCQSLGNTVVVSPALAAWLPLLVLGPVAYVMAARHWE